MTSAKTVATKDRLLDAAESFMRRKGFTATSLDDICKEAGVTKGCFFHYFKNKEHLGKVLLERFCLSSSKKMEECGCGYAREKDPLKRLYGYLDFSVAMSRESDLGQGCLIGAFTQELSDSHPQLRGVCAQGFEEWAKIIKRDLTEAKARYAPRASIDVQSLADHFIALMEGSQILAKAKQNKKIIGKNMEHFKRYLQFLFKR